MTTFDVPAATVTQPFGINSAGQIVGDCSCEAGKSHDFLRTAAGTFTVVDVPGASGTTAGSINDAGQIAGWCSIGPLGQNANQGFLRSPAGALTTVDVGLPGA